MGYVYPIEIFKCGRCFKLIDMENSKGGFARMYPCFDCEKVLKAKLAKTQEALKVAVYALERQKDFILHLLSEQEARENKLSINEIVSEGQAISETLAKIKEIQGD